MVSHLLLRASLRSSRQHPLQLAMLLLGIMLGIAVVAAMQLSTQSARLSYQYASAQLVSSASHQITSPAGIPTALYSQLKRAPEQWPLLPVVEFPVQLSSGERLTLTGLDMLAEQQAVAMPGGVGDSGGKGGWGATLLHPGIWLADATAEQLGLVAGEPLTLTTPVGVRRVTLSGTWNSTQQPAFSQRIIMDIGQALALSGTPEQLSYLRLLPQASGGAAQEWGAEQMQLLRKQLPTGVRLTPLDNPQPVRLGDALYFNLNAMALLALLLGSLIVLSAVWLSLLQRRPLFAALRLAGVSGRQLYGFLLLETLCVAGLASAMGIGLGVLIADQLLPLLVHSQAAFNAPPLARLSLDGWALVGLWLLGVASALLAASWPCWQLAQQSPLALQSAPVTALAKVQRPGRGYRSLLFGVLCLAGVLVGQAGLVAVYAGIALLALAASWLTTPLLQALAAGCVHGLKRSALAGRYPWLLMVPRDCLRQQMYSKGVMWVLMLALSVSLAVTGMTDSFHSAFQGWIGQRLNAQLYISAQPAGPALTPQLQTQLMADPRVVSLDRRARSVVELDGLTLSVYGADLPEAARSAYRLRQGDSETLWQAFTTRPTVLISEPLANHLQLNRGDQLTLPLAKGEQAFTIAGIYYDYGSYQGQVLLSYDQFIQHLPEVPLRGLRVYLHQPERAAEIAAEPWLQPWQVRRAGPILQRSEQLFEQTFLITDALQGLLLSVALVAMVSNLLALQLHRQPELQRYRALGLSRTMRAGLLMGQALLLALSAGLLAWLLGEMIAWCLAERVQLLAFGWTVPWQFSAGRGLLTLVLGLIVALLAALYPALREVKV